MIDAAGTVAATYTYGPYGTPLTQTGTLYNPWRYKTGYTDTTTGLTKYGNRYYDPATGRWTQQDSLTFLNSPAQGNRYAAFGADPTNNTDPSGRYSWNEFACDLVGGPTTAAIVGGAAIAIGVLGVTGVGAVAAFGLATAVGGCAGGALADNTETILDGGTSTTGDIAGSCAAGAITAGIAGLMRTFRARWLLAWIVLTACLLVFHIASTEFDLVELTAQAVLAGVLTAFIAWVFTKAVGPKV